ncbi:EF-hand domain-containing protein [Dechloromonas sp. A34]|uniref:EF-hand domain-containing protein n=1 Tax=Dechloromonas sp. A34 TaxID=447588 RepID=UPI0022489852|nr:EF-hand domain-containing protein [Dechloromonas sp. A34]
MKEANSRWYRNLALTAVLLTALNGHGADGGAPDAGKAAASPLPPTTPPEIIKPALPSDLKSADAVFDELDVGRRGYVTRHDTKDLLGFGEAFRSVDSRRSGKLTRAQFRRAWAIYKAPNQ